MIPGDVTYIRNPYHENDPRLILDAQLATEKIRARIAGLILHEHNLGVISVIEKVSLHAARIGYFKTLAPGATFVHILWDETDDARHDASFEPAKTTASETAATCTYAVSTGDPHII